MRSRRRLRRHSSSSRRRRSSSPKSRSRWWSPRSTTTRRSRSSLRPSTARPGRPLSRHPTTRPSRWSSRRSTARLRRRLPLPPRLARMVVVASTEGAGRLAAETALVGPGQSTVVDLDDDDGACRHRGQAGQRAERLRRARRRRRTGRRRGRPARFDGRRTVVTAVAARHQRSGGDSRGEHEPWSITVLEIEDGRIAFVNSFLDTANLYPMFGLGEHPEGVE